MTNVFLSQCAADNNAMRVTDIKTRGLSYFLPGLDIPKHGEPAYPAEAWGDGWGSFLAVSDSGLGKWHSSRWLRYNITVCSLILCVLIIIVILIVI